ncbi:MAG: glycosyltransferase family 2 protein, partial [Actinomadura sp.]
MSVTRISVIVLAHGAGESLPDTLASVAAQTRSELDVLVMDDGTGVTAETIVPDDRFRIIRKGALSRGAARNLGVEESDGDFLLFVDGGDELPATAVEALVSSLRASGSDIALGRAAVRRWTGQVSEWRPSKPTAEPAKGTDLGRTPDLLRDRKVSGKLFRRSFWTANALEFPDLSRYDDLPAMVKALHLAEAVDVLDEVVLHRRNRLFEQTTEAQEIADGFGAVTLATTWLEENGHVKARRNLQLLAVQDELRAFLDALPDVPAEERDQVVAQAAAYASGVPAKLLADASALTRLKWHLATTGRTTELVKVVRYERGKASPSIVRDPLRRYVVYPYWKDSSLGIPREVYRARGEVKMRGRVHSVAWDGDRLTITGEAYINSVSMRRRWTSVKTMTLRSGKRKIVAKARQTPKPGKKSGWSGFEFTFDVGRLRNRGEWVEGEWDVQASVFNAGVFRRGPLRPGSSGSGVHPPYHYVADDVRVVPMIEDRRLVIKVEKVTTKATALRWDGDALVIEGRSAGEPPSELVLSLGDDRVPVPVTPAGDGFTARVDPADLEGSPIPPERIDDTRDWTVFAGGRPLVLAEGVDDIERTFGPLEV